MSKGKNFSGNNLGQRKKSDFYETPYSMTEQLLSAEKFPKEWVVLEPACGQGAIVKVLRKEGFRTKSFDKEVDFLKYKNNHACAITNPPFSLAFEFVLQCKKLVKYKFALLLPLSYLHGKERFDKIYNDESYPLKKVYVFTRYPMLGDPLRADGSYRTGMMVYAWYVWDRAHRGPATLAWLDNNEHVARKS